ncbi:MAG: hypothetical protein BYD32DRAFT_406277 [Podila humilis]|nr:MAG: hypothetical protein BYD32DRAFT_406277 [Podila humilis]
MSNVLSILFGYAYRFEDLKKELLKYVIKNLAEMYEDDKDPFEDYKDHPERHNILAEILKLKCKATD